MKICVINLDRAPDRWAFSAKQAERLGLAVQRIPAIDGYEIVEEDLLKSCAPRRSGNRCTRFELAVYRSHALAWQAIVDSGDPFGVVFEDDIFLSDESPTFLRDPRWVPADADVVKLNATNLMMTLGAVPTPISGRRELRRIFQRSPDAGGYLLSRRHAEALLERSAPIVEAVDLFLFDPKAVKGLYQMNPGLCIQAIRADFAFLAPEAGASQVQVHRSSAPSTSGFHVHVRRTLSRGRAWALNLRWTNGIRWAFLRRERRISSQVPFLQ
jgi:glycosyl transferase, family 25